MGPSTGRGLLAAWIAVGSALLAASWALARCSAMFDASVAYADKPALALAAGLAAAGLVFAILKPLLTRTCTAGLGGDRRLIAFIVAAGFALRFALFGSLPALEDDWYRYLWDGAVTAHGYNPYAVSPDDAQGDAFAATLQPLAHESGIVIERINHSGVKTIYPPLAQAAFALAHLLKPWGLDAWRLVCLVAESLTLVLILALLKILARPAAWAAVYWWNPVVVKELMNSAHMEAVLMPFVVGALLLAVKERRIAATATLALAAGVKLWPVILVPLVLRPLVHDRGRLILAFGVLAGLLAALAVPVVAGGLDTTSGFFSYATRWQTNSAVFPAVAGLFQTALGALGVSGSGPALLARSFFALLLVLVIARVVRSPVTGPGDEIRRATLIVTAVLLLSPAQFPWYLVWVLPLACVHPWRVFFAATMLLPVYYASFHFLARDDYGIYRDGIVWLVWLPIYAAFWLDIGEERGPHA